MYPGLSNSQLDDVKDHLKDELITVQRHQNHFLGMTATGFAGQLLVGDFVRPESVMRMPLSITATAVSLIGIIGEMYHVGHRHRLENQLKTTTQLATTTQTPETTVLPESISSCSCKDKDNSRG